MVINFLAVRKPRALIVIRKLSAAEVRARRIFFHHLDRGDILSRLTSPHLFAKHLLPGFTQPNEGITFAALDPSETILGIVDVLYFCPGAAEISVIVRPDHRRRGVGRALLDHAINRADGDGLSLLVGYVFSDNLAMLSLARVMGFQSIRWDSTSFEIRRLISAKTI